MSRIVLFAVLTLLMNPVQAVICKQVDAQGVVSYSDLPRDKCTQPVTLPDYSRYAPRPISPAPQPALLPSSEGKDDTQTAQPFSGYTEMRIEQPAEGASVWNNEGKVPVAVFLSPALQPGHKIQILLDGQPAGPPFGSLAAALTNVDRGTHRISAQLLDQEGNVLKKTGPVSFTLHRTSVNSPARKSADDGSTAPQGFAPIPATPGKTNPAFAPRYTPGN